MDELYKMLREKLAEMRTCGDSSVRLSFYEVSRLYQLVCMMRQIKDIADWCSNGYS